MAEIELHDEVVEWMDQLDQAVLGEPVGDEAPSVAILSIKQRNNERTEIT